MSLMANGVSMVLMMFAVLVFVMALMIMTSARLFVNFMVLIKFTSLIIDYDFNGFLDVCDFGNSVTSKNHEAQAFQNPKDGFPTDVAKKTATRCQTRRACGRLGTRSRTKASSFKPTPKFSNQKLDVLGIGWRKCAGFMAEGNVAAKTYVDAPSACKEQTLYNNVR